MIRGIKILFGAIALLYLAGTSYQMYLFLDFQSHKEEIIKAHCENKDKPEMHCDGNCHFKKEVRKSPVQAIVVEETTEKSPSYTMVSFDTFSTIVYSKELSVHAAKDQLCHHHDNPYHFLWVVKDTHPPEEV